MAVILNASTSSGFVQSADTSGVITLQNNGTSALSVTSGNLQFNSGYGSVATAYGCRAWVNFNGTGTVAIRGSGNVTSITDNGTGDYTVNFTTAMPDVNYSIVVNGAVVTGGGGTNGVVCSERLVAGPALERTVSTYRFITLNTAWNNSDCFSASVSIFR
jgi:uncharacterized protein (AIM24 family)